MFSKGVVLIFLILGLSSSIAHAIPHQDRAPDPCEDTPGHKKNPSVLTSKNPTTKKDADKSPKKGTDKSPKKGADKSPKKGKTTGGKGGDTTATGDDKKKIVNPQGSGKKATLAADPQGNKNGTGNNDLNTSLCVDQTVLSKGSQSDGLNNATAGTSASLTSTNNFINFCSGKTITNGQQVKEGSCNPVPMGVIASTQNIPSCKYVFPKNLDTLKANTAFTMKLAVKNVQLGVFTNPEATYYSAPQQVNNQGAIIGHTHLVVEQVESLTSTTPLDSTKFAFFKGIDNAADGDGTVSADVTAGLPEGVYRFMTIGTSANHVPFLVAVAQHGSMDDAVYATVTADGNPGTANNSTTTGNTTATNPKTGPKGNGTDATNSTATGSAAGGAKVKGKDTGATNSTDTGTTKGKDKGKGTTDSTATGDKKFGDTASKSKNNFTGDKTTGKLSSVGKNLTASPSPSPKGGKDLAASPSPSLKDLTASPSPSPKGGKGGDGENGHYHPARNKRRAFSLEYRKD